ncbi:MAG: hypothetical protein J0I41_16895 [Filimonas sp.]|nr:hypothetical protein [Filimonas sp.]
MQILVRANAFQQKEWLESNMIPVRFTTDLQEWLLSEADILIDLLYDIDQPTGITNVPVIVNSMLHTCQELPYNYIRLNGWNGFLSKPVKEIAVTAYFGEQKLQEVMDALQWQYAIAPDVPGFASARTIAMIINEAYFALGDNVSSKEDIDTAMKLGTNYPFGPFEWASRIGLQNIYDLLLVLSKTDERYVVADALIKEVSLQRNT